MFDAVLTWFFFSLFLQFLKIAACFCLFDADLFAGLTLQKSMSIAQHLTRCIFDVHIVLKTGAFCSYTYFTNDLIRAWWCVLTSLPEEDNLCWKCHQSCPHKIRELGRRQHCAGIFCLSLAKFKTLLFDDTWLMCFQGWIRLRSMTRSCQDMESCWFLIGQNRDCINWFFFGCK